MIKNQIVSCGRKLIDILAWITLVAIIIGAIGASITNESMGLAFWIIGPIIYIFTFYWIYLFIDIRDKLEIIITNQNDMKLEHKIN